MICLLEPYTHRLLRLMSRIKLKHVCILFAVVWILDLFGAFTHIFELSYDKHFKYPYDGDIQPFIEALKRKKKPEMDPINDYNYTYVHDGREYCVDNDFKTHRLVFLIKSAAPNFERRAAIRSTWGFQKRFFDVPTKTIFMLGVHENDYYLQERINEEAGAYNDILQANFIDSYYNNTIKTMMGFKWAYYHCRNAKFYMFVDDDMYVSVKNVLRFIRNPAYYPEYLKDPSRMVKREVREDDGDDVTGSNKNVLLVRQMSSTEAGFGTVKNALNDEVTRSTSRVARATAREKILMRRREGWKKHNKTRLPLTEKGGLGDDEDLNGKGNGATSVSNVQGAREGNRKGRQRRWSSALTENALDDKVTGEVRARVPLTEDETIRNALNDEVKSDGRKPKVIALNDRIETIKNALNGKVKRDVNGQGVIALNGKVKTNKPLTGKALKKGKTDDFDDETRKETFNGEGLHKALNVSDDYLKLTRGRRQVLDLELPDDVRLFAGYVFVSSPHRHKTSKWYVPLSEYPFHLWPPYVTAGAYVLSKVALVDMYLTSLYTKHFRFDDIYLGIVAKKADIEPFHCDEFHFYKRDYTRFNYKYVIASHGYGNPEELMAIWNEQKAMGNA